MKRFYLQYFMVALLTLLLVTGCESKGKRDPQDTKTNEQTSPEINNKVSTDTDTLNDIARFAAGIYLDPKSPMKRMEETEGWKKHHTEINDSWSKIQEGRLTPMGEWVKNDFSTLIDPKLPLFYPFSGPDFLHCYILYPDAPVYVYCALEGVGEVPPISTMSPTNLDNFLSAVQYSLRDIYKRSYFITENMGGDLQKHKVNGVIPLIMVFMARQECSIVSCDLIALDNNAKIVPMKKGAGIPGVKFVFTPKGSNEEKTLYYFSGDISDEGAPKTKAFFEFVKTFGPMNSFVKSASYLMHYGTFNKIRELVLEVSKSVYQDDTGIAYRFFKKDIWDFILFGNYEKPISDFKGVDQPDLQKAYQDTSIVRPVPFSLGYHWRSGVQNQMLARKKN